MTTHECGRCELEGVCSRHPGVQKTGAFLAICRGEGSERVRAKWMAKWDAECNGQEYEPPSKNGTTAPKLKAKSCCGGTSRPTLFQKTVSLTRAVARWIAAGRPITPDEESARRHAICDDCPLNKRGFCEGCGCHISTKTKMATEKCPKDKWLEWFPGRNEPESQKRLVITIAVGTEFQNILSLTKPFMESYASKCGADFVALTDATQQWPMYEKFRVHEWSEHYDQTLFLDADCLVKPKCRNLFEIVPKDSIAIHDDVALNRDNTWLRRAWDRVHESQGIFRQIDEPLSVLNSGVVLCNSETRDAWLPPTKPLSTGHEDEQVWVQSNIQDRGYPVYRLPREFNEQWYTQKTETGNSPEKWERRAAEASIIHFARCPKRTEEIKKWIDLL